MEIQELLNRRLLELSGTPVTLGTILTAFVIFGVAMILSRIVRRVADRTFRRSGVKDDGTIATFDRLLHYGFLLVGAAVALANLGLDLSALFTTGAVAAVALAFALQNILQNFVSGIILLAERSITPLDILDVEGEMVRVERMGIRATIVRTLEDEQIIMPNSNLVQASVKNLTLADQYFRVRTDVGVAYSTDLDKASEVLARGAASVEGRAKDRDPVINLKAFGDSSIVFGVSVWVEDPWHVAAMLSKLNFAVWRALRDAEITIAFPQLDVHLVSNEAGLGTKAG